MTRTKKARFINYIGESLRSDRKEAGLTVKQVASRLGVSNQLVTYWEGGKRPIPIVHYSDYCKILGISASKLLAKANEHIRG